MDKFKFIELNYYSHEDLDDPSVVIQKHLPSNLFAQSFLRYAEISLVKHMNYTGKLNLEGIHYHFFKRRNGFFQVPFAAHRFIADQKPDLVLVQGFIFPMQVIHLRKKIGKKAIILLQHHGETPFGKKNFIQKIADRFIQGYLFSGRGLAAPWLQAGIIRGESKCFELPSSSTLFTRQNKEQSRNTIDMPAGTHFLWVGRLNANKDPLTILKGFEKYAENKNDVFLSMIYGDADLESELKRYINSSVVLKKNTKLVGKLPHHQLENWYSAADYFISGSWSEGGSYALTEAMACGCVPIVTNIPASMKAIEFGKFGYFFEPGDYHGLATILSELKIEEQDILSQKIVEHFERANSKEAVAEKLMTIYQSLQNR